MGQLPAQLLDSPYWWASHLVESACSTGDQAYEYIYEAFGLQPEDFAGFWTDTLNMNNEYGPWPEFILSIPGFAVNVAYLGTPRHEVKYGLSTFGQVHWVGGLGGHGVSPAFRWDEIDRFSRRTPAREASLLLLLPACEISAEQREEARETIRDCFKALGYEGPLIDRFSKALAGRLDYGRHWHYDETYGWLSDHGHSWRCPEQRRVRGLTVAPDEQFFLFKSLTGYLGLNQ
ncbi:MAG: hypothetical protein ABJF10_04625 [Chthoniobacter sp.]|uniref:hypothetical protein n=1 Tax=Chthoniobacter sp. TaxID=2510640 RepID=UPI0032A4E1EB